MPTNPIVNSRVFIHNPTPLRVAMRMSVNGGYPSSHMLEPGQELYFDGGPHPAFVVDYDADLGPGIHVEGYQLRPGTHNDFVIAHGKLDLVCQL